MDLPAIVRSQRHGQRRPQGSAYPLTFQLIIKRQFFFKATSTMRSIPTNQPQHILFKNNNSHHSITFLLTSTTFSHSSSFTIPFTPPTPFPDHLSLLHFPFIPSILAPSPLHLNSCKHHTSIILFLSSSQTSPFPLRLPKFHIANCTPKGQSCLPSYCKLCLHAPGCEAASSFQW